MNEPENHARYEIDPQYICKWEKMLDLIAEIMGIPVALIMRAHPEAIEVLAKGGISADTFHKGDMLRRVPGLYCETVIETRRELMVSNAQKDPKWADSISASRGMFAYMGYPIFWPAGDVFGTVCVMDTQERSFSGWHKRMMSSYARIIQDDLAGTLAMQSMRQTEEKFKTIFQLSPAAILITSMQDGTILDANQSYLDLFGFSYEELIGNSGLALNMIDPDEREEVLRKIRNNEPVRDYKMVLGTNSGDIKYCLGSVEQIQIEGRPCLIFTIHDITSMTKMEGELIQSRKKYRDLFYENSAARIVVDIENGAIVDANPAALKFYGYSKEELVGKCITEINGYSLKYIQEKLKEAYSQQDNRFEAKHRLKNGEVRDVEVFNGPIDIDGRKYINCIVHDITDRKLAEKKLKESEKRYRSLFHNSGAMQAIFDMETGEIWDANAAACTFYGFPLDQFIGKKIWDFNTLGKEYSLKDVKKRFDKGVQYVTTYHKRYDGALREVEIFNSPVEINGRRMLNAIIHDITEKRQAERELMKSEERFRTLIDNAPDGIFVQTDQKFAFVNKRAIQMFGASGEEDLLGKSVPDHFSIKDRKQVEERIRMLNEEKRAVPLVEEAIGRMDGTELDVEVLAVPFQYNRQDGALVFMRDITQRMEMERDKENMEMQLRQKQKLESIGTLAGGVAHEINNPLNGIINYAQLIEDAGLDDKTKEYASEIILEGERIAGIVKNLLSFARQEKQNHSPALINDIIGKTVSLIQTVLRHDQIMLEIEIPEDLPSIKCRSQQIQQVVMNLITNARDALKGRYKGYDQDKKIMIFCSMFEKEGRRWIRTTVEDHGMGIPDDVCEKMFDPFFTTKPREEGTGLGLSISHGIVKEHHGELYFETVLGKYTRAVMELPVDNGWAVE